MAKMSSQERLIALAERFAAGCSRSRLELRLVDEIHRLNRRIKILSEDTVAQKQIQEAIDHIRSAESYGDELDPEDLLVILGGKDVK